MMPGVNCVIYGCSTAKTTPGVSLAIPELNTGGKYYTDKMNRWQGEGDRQGGI